MTSQISAIYNKFAHRSGHTKFLSIDLDAKPLFVVTGAGFTKYDQVLHGNHDTHAFFEAQSSDNSKSTYLMNNGATVAIKLLNEGHNVLIHGRDSAKISEVLRGYDQSKLSIIGGDLASEQDTITLFKAVSDFGQTHSISEVRIMAYQSFAQSSGSPFKPMHEETACDVAHAASRRIYFSYHIAALGYWLMCEQDQSSLRIISLSALAAKRASYGLLADAMDKHANDAMWRTFHIEANHLTGKPVNVVTVNPGITTACDVYEGDDMRKFISEEAQADGFPLSNDIVSGKTKMPQLSAHDVAEVITRMMTYEEHQDTSINLPSRVKEALYAGYTPTELDKILNKTVSHNNMGDGLDFARFGHAGPEHLYAPYTRYGQLPDIEPRSFQRISLTPSGQKF